MPRARACAGALEVVPDGPLRGRLPTGLLLVSESVPLRIFLVWYTPVSMTAVTDAAPAARDAIPRVGDTSAVVVLAPSIRAVIPRSRDSSAVLEDVPAITATKVRLEVPSTVTVDVPATTAAILVAGGAVIVRAAIVELTAFTADATR